MGEIQILDCTLRDGGRCFDNMWGDDTIRDISGSLCNAGVDVIEIGFLRYLSYGICRVNSTNFRDIFEMEEFIGDPTKYVAYVEYTVYKKDHYTIPRNEGFISGIRLGVTKDEIDESLPLMQEIIEKGYNLYVQGINIMSYTDDELTDFARRVNTLNPYAFAIVDTYGAMNYDDLKNKYNIIDKILDKNICIAFHSHNNQKQSLYLAEKIIDLAKDRTIIIDATINGIGMGAGNLPLEEVTSLVNQKYNGHYDTRIIGDVSDKYIKPLSKKFLWYPENSSVVSSKKHVAQINYSYLRNEYSGLNDDVYESIINLFPAGKGLANQRIDELVSIVCNSTNDNDTERLKKELYNKKIVIIGKGQSIHESKEELVQFTKNNDTIVIYINHLENYLDVPEERAYYWYMTKAKLNNRVENYGNKHTITFSGLANKSDFRIKYSNEYMKNVHIGDSIIIIMNILMYFGVCDLVYIAGMDGKDVSDISYEYTVKDLKFISSRMKYTYITSSEYEEI